MRKILFTVLAAAMYVGCSAGTESQLKLWYDAPARQWTDALPLGNGRLGAMVFGTPAQERIQINEETIWGGGPHNNVNYAAKDGLDKIRTALWEGRRSDAQALCDEYISSKSAHGMPYQTAGSLMLDFDGITDFTDYYRELDINRAVALTRFKANGTEYTRECFVSLPDQVIVMRLTASAKGAITFKASYNLPYRDDRIIARSAQADGQQATMTISCKGDDHEGIEGKIRFTDKTLIVPQGGQVKADGNTIAVSDADAVTIYISIGTNFVNYQSVSGNENEAAMIVNKDIYVLRSEYSHIAHDQEELPVDFFTGFDVIINDKLRGKISDIDDSTANVLFVIEISDGSQTLIPAVEDFIIGIDIDNRLIELEVPDELLSL